VNPTAADAVRLLGTSSSAQPAKGFPRDVDEVSTPGLYAWRVDDAGLATVSAPFDSTLPSLIYAGQAGAASTRTGKVGSATLLSRINGNHLRGNVGSSTFRKTLTAVLLEPLGLRLAGPSKLSAASNELLSEWMRAHLAVAVVSCPERVTLAALEHDVLAELDPPLNLQGMNHSGVRSELRLLRKRLAHWEGEV